MYGKFMMHVDKQVAKNRCERDISAGEGFKLIWYLDIWFINIMFVKFSETLISYFEKTPPSPPNSENIYICTSIFKGELSIHAPCPCSAIQHSA